MCLFSPSLPITRLCQQVRLRLVPDKKCINQLKVQFKLKVLITLNRHQLSLKKRMKYTIKHNESENKIENKLKRTTKKCFITIKSSTKNDIINSKISFKIMFNLTTCICLIYFILQKKKKIQ